VSEGLTGVSELLEGEFEQTALDCLPPVTCHLSSDECHRRVGRDLDGLGFDRQRSGSVKHIIGMGDRVRISRIKIRNFANFSDFDIVTSNDLVVVGENKVGKTNLLYALQLV
jgi:hypothetical protein